MHMARLTSPEKAEVVRALLKIAQDDRESAWAARLYMAAAVWIAREIDDAALRGETTKVADRVKRLTLADSPTGFQASLDSWVRIGK
jgi:RNA polymerase-interacting CarD/CdnL/TRCF family regulator